MAEAETYAPIKPKNKLAAWLLWLLFGWLGADRIYLDRWLAAILEAALTGVSAVLFLSRPTQALLGQFGAAVAPYGGGLAGLGSLWQAEAMLCCLAALLVLKLTDAANINRAVDNANRPGGTRAYARPELSKTSALLLICLPLAAGLAASAVVSGVSSYVCAAPGFTGTQVGKLMSLQRALVLLVALYTCLRAASRAASALSRWLYCVPPLIMLGLPALYHLLYRYFGFAQFSMLLPDPFSSEWLRGVLWNSDTGLAGLLQAAGGTEERLKLAADVIVIEGGLALGVAAILTAAVALVPWRAPRKRR